MRIFLAYLLHDHPVISGIVLFVFGIFWVNYGVTSRSKYAKFVNGPQVVGIVIELSG